MVEQKQRILEIINEELSRFYLEIQVFIKKEMFKDAKIAAKAAKRLEKMVCRIQIEV